MEIEVRRQLLQLSAAFAAGFLLGTVYDIFRVLRRRSGKDALPDALFGIILCATLFTLGMSVGEGVLNWGMAAFAVLGFAFYMLTVSNTVLIFMTKVAETVGQIVRICLKPLKTGVNFLVNLSKNTFSKIRNRFTMVKKSCKRHEAENEEENAYANNNGFIDYGGTDVRSHKPGNGGGRASGCAGADGVTAERNRKRRKRKQNPQHKRRKPGQ